MLERIKVRKKVTADRHDANPASPQEYEILIRIDFSLNPSMKALCLRLPDSCFFFLCALNSMMLHHTLVQQEARIHRVASFGISCSFSFIVFSVSMFIVFPWK